MSESMLIFQLVKNDPRYSCEAYNFVRHGLCYATEVLQYGNQSGKAEDEDGKRKRELNFSALVDLGEEANLLPAELNDLQADSGESSKQEKDTVSENQGDESATELELNEEGQEIENHLTGQELCQALRQFAIDQYGLLAKSVLNSWGIFSTSDFGSIVYNIIDIGLMKKSENDRREHFDEVYDFQEVFVEQFKINR